MKRNTLTFIALSTVLSSTAWGADVSLAGDKLGYGFGPGLQAGKDFVAGQVIVGLVQKGGKEVVAQAAQALGGRLEKAMDDNSAILLSFGSEKAALAAVNALGTRSDVKFIERNGFMRIPPKPQQDHPRSLKWNPLQGPASQGPVNPSPQAVSTDPGTGFQWHHTVIRKTAALPALSATPPTVAVIDTGVDYTHPDLAVAGKVIKGKNAVANNLDPYDDNSHGTHVAGIIAASATNNAYGEGVCPNCKILAVKVLTAEGWGTFFDIADGMAWTVANRNTTTPPTKVVNMSLGGSSSALIAAQVLAMKNAGMVLAAAAGNSNTTSTTGAFPGADSNTTLRVMATEQNDCRAWFSNFSPSTAATQYNIAAPGWLISSTVPELGYAVMSGTSMASPVVAGAAALIWGQLPALTRDQLVTRLVSNGKQISCGFAAATRRVDVRKAITGTSETADIGRLLDPFSSKAPSSNTNPANARLFNGATQDATDATNRGGFYEMTGLTMTGVRNLKGDRATAPAFVNAKVRNVNIATGVITGPFTDALPLARATGNATITLDWKNFQPTSDTTGCGSGCNGWEFDLWVRLPDGSYVGWANPGDLLTTPFVFNPRDSFNDGEPLETSVIGSAAANGVYKVFVDNSWTGTTSWSDSWTGSGASVQLYNGAASIGTFYAGPPAACGTNEFWYIGDLTKTGTTYTWTNKNTCSNTSP